MTKARSIVLLVGQVPDPHIETIQETLEDKGCETILLNRRSPDNGMSVLIDDGKLQTVYRDKEKYLHTDAIASVWWRLKPTVPPEFGLGGTVNQSFAWAEWKGLLRSLQELIPHAKWINSIEKHAHIGRKLHQLKLATDVGLTAPDTIVTNSAADALRLFEKHERVVYKTLSSFIAPPKHIVFTTEITREELLDGALGVSLAPGIFQQYIEKAFELRVTVIGEQIFTVRIDSQSREDTEIDWRKNQFAEIFEIGELSSVTKERLLQFHKLAGITYGAYDFIVTPEGEEIFLECNPGGQWLWLEHATGLPMSKALANCLLPDSQ